MKASDRAVRLASRAAVVLWMASFLAGRPPADPPLQLVALEPMRMAPEPTAPLEPSATSRVPEPPARSSTPPPPPPDRKPTPIGDEALEVGEGLLGDSGAFPPLSSSYEHFGSFPEYARAMEALGARFVVVRHHRILARIELESGILHGLDARTSFSPRARDYSDEPDLLGPTRTARDRYGPDAQVMMLVPRRFDAGLFGAIARILDERGEPHTGYRELRGRYERTAGGEVALRIESGVRMDGSRTPLDLLFDLSKLARSGALPGAAGPRA